MRGFLVQLLGNYVPPTYTDYIQGAEGVLTEVQRIPDGFAGVDWLYILTALLFIVVVYSFFKILGGVLCRAF